MSYPANIFFWVTTSFCCCFSKCCDKVSVIQKGSIRYRKYQLALDRLSQEQDIQYLIQMNRISRLLHKFTLEARQRRAINYSHKYVISEKDIKRAEVAKADGEVAKAPEDNDTTEKILNGFDPNKNEKDRRLLYEVAGIRLFENEFIDDSSSDSDGGVDELDLNDLDLASETYALN